MNSADRARTLPAMLDLLVSDPGRPRLTWYGDEFERVELSGAVLANWVSKTVNLLVEEFDAGPGSVVVVDLPVHWRSVVWSLAAWRCGATVVPTDPSGSPSGELPGDADVVVTSRPGAWGTTGAEIVAVALPALARRFDGDLPAGAVDAAAVMTYGDVIGWAPDAEPSGTALQDAGGPTTFADLVGGGTAVGEPGDRVLVGGDRPTAEVLRELLAVWSLAGSVVLCSAGTTVELRADDARRERLRDTERVTDGAGEL